MASADRPAVEFRALKTENVGDLGTVLRGNFGAGCWCMFPRLTDSQMRELPGTGPLSPRRREAMTALAGRERAPGLLAYEDGEPVGWIAVAPRSELTRIARSRATPPVDAEPVWVIPCVTVRKSHRGHGIAIALIRTRRGGLRGRTWRAGGGSLPPGVWRTHRRRQRLFRHRGDVSLRRIRGGPGVFAPSPPQLASEGHHAHRRAGKFRTGDGLTSSLRHCVREQGRLMGQATPPAPPCSPSPCLSLQRRGTSCVRSNCRASRWP